MNKTLRRLHTFISKYCIFSSVKFWHDFVFNLKEIENQDHKHGICTQLVLLFKLKFLTNR